MVPRNQTTIEAVPTDSASNSTQNIFGSGWIQPSLTEIDLGGSPVGIVDELYVRYEPETEPTDWMEAEDWAAALDAMSADPQIQSEIGAIEEEFALTLQDGLED